MIYFYDAMQYYNTYIPVVHKVSKIGSTLKNYNINRIIKYCIIM